jgi:hypothetical protein
VPSPAPTIRCVECGHEVPALEYCVRCGDPLAEEKRGRTALAGRRRQFAAQAGEDAAGVHVVSTLFPQLPRADMATFRTVLLIGVATIVGLAGLGLFPLALIAAAVLVPLILVLYVWDVDVYEDEPLRVMALTAAWGIAAGVVMGLAIRLLPSGGGILSGMTSGEVLGRGVVIPIVSGVAMVAGPLVLLPYRKFNDVLDGATFGATSAASFSAAVVLSQGLDLFTSGLRPPGDSLPWIVRLLSLGIATPLIAAGVIGAAAGAFWLRYRGPSQDRAALGPFGSPAIASLAAGAALIVSALGALLLPVVPSLAWQALLAAIALVWLRTVIHLGLLQEAAEMEIGPPVRCPNCGQLTPAHTFCGQCGTALRAAPKRPAATAPAGPADRPA